MDCFTNVLETFPYGIIVTDSDGVIIFCNQAVLGISGYGKEEILGTGPEIIISGIDDNPELPVGSQSPDSSGSPCAYIERKGRKKDGTEFYSEISTSIARIDGKNYSVYCIYDITRRALEKKGLLERNEVLSENYEELSRIFRKVKAIKDEWERTMDCAGVMVALVDNQGKIKRCNKALKEFIGKRYAEILGCDWGELLFNNRMKPGALQNKGAEIYHEPSGKWFIINSYPFNIIHEAEISGDVVIIHDSTEMKKITLELKKKNDELETTYTALKSMQSQILQQEKMASIGQLAAGIAHEINNPIGFISSNLGSLDRYLSKITEFIGVQSETIMRLHPQKAVMEELAERRNQLKVDYIILDIKDLIKESLDGAERVNKIVQDMKSFSRINEKEDNLADINAGLDSTINIVWNELKYKAVLIKDYGDIPMTKCNQGQINQIFMNLLINAAHAIEKNGEIAVKTWSSDGSIFVSISDTGSGIPDDVKNRIFEPFFTTKEVGKGTGLGLSIAYDIIKKHNGHINVDSKAGEGTTFTLSIPIVQ